MVLTKSVAVHLNEQLNLFSGEMTFIASVSYGMITTGLV
jgi:hypothetical protein